MNILLLICCCNLLSAFSVTHKITPKLCVNCKFFLNYCVDTKYGKCSLFPTKERGYKFLVDGKEDPTEYYYCSTARSSDDMCGVEGKKYVRKYKKTKS